MQFVPYIKFSFSHLMRYSIIPLKVLLLLTLIMSGCSSVPEGDVDETIEVKSISKDIIDLLGIPQNKNTRINQSTNKPQQLISETKNTYLEQEAALIADVSNDVIAIYQQALMLMDQQKWSAANVLFDQVIAKQPNLSGSYVNQALILRELNKHQQGTKRTEQFKTAELLIDKAISVNSINPYAHYLKGKIQQDKGQFKQAEQRYAKALSIWPSYAQAQLSMAILLELYRGKLLEAYPYYTDYLQHNLGNKQVQRWQAALTIKIKRAGLRLPAQKGE